MNFCQQNLGTAKDIETPFNRHYTSVKLKKQDDGTVEITYGNSLLPENKIYHVMQNDADQFLKKWSKQTFQSDNGTALVNQQALNKDLEDIAFSFASEKRELQQGVECGFRGPLRSYSAGFEKYILDLLKPDRAGSEFDTAKAKFTTIGSGTNYQGTEFLRRGAFQLGATQDKFKERMKKVAPGVRVVIADKDKHETLQKRAEKTKSLPSNVKTLTPRKEESIPEITFELSSMDKADQEKIKKINSEFFIGSVLNYLSDDNPKIITDTISEKLIFLVNDPQMAPNAGARLNLLSIIFTHDEASKISQEVKDETAKVMKEIISSIEKKCDLDIYIFALETIQEEDKVPRDIRDKAKNKAEELKKLRDNSDT